MWVTNKVFDMCRGHYQGSNIGSGPYMGSGTWLGVWGLKYLSLVCSKMVGYGV